MKHEPIPHDFEVQPLKPGEEAKVTCTCGTCGLSWDDGKVTSMTPTPSARCPFEYFHRYGTRTGKPLKKFIITETIRVEIKATSMEAAKKRWLGKDTWELMRKGFIDVKDRFIEPHWDDMPKREPCDPQLYEEF